MSVFEKAIDFVLLNEGELSENPNDAGGITNFGISLRFLRELPQDKLRKYGIFEPVTDYTIRMLTLDQAKLIYKGEFWEGNNFEKINSQTVCTYLFDMAINLGISQAIKLIQRAICAANHTKGYIKDDGIMGELTIVAINTIGHELLPILVGIRAEFYRFLVAMGKLSETLLEGLLQRTFAII